MVLVSQSEKDRAALGALSVPQVPAENPDYRGIVIKKPWGSETEVFRDQAVSMWMLNIEPDAETSMHAHPNKTTILAVVAGEVLCSTLVSSYALVPGDAILIEKGAFHRTYAPRGATVLETEYPVNKHDLVRLSDRYGRGQGYENGS